MRRSASQSRTFVLGRVGASVRGSLSTRMPILLTLLLLASALPAVAHDATPEASPVVAAPRVLQSERYGFFLSLYAGWGLDAQDGGGDQEGWTFSNAPLNARFDVMPTTSDAAACLADAVASLQNRHGAANVTLRQEVGGNILPGLDLTSAAALYIVTSGTAATVGGEAAVLIQCRPVPGQPAILQMVLQSPSDLFNEQLDRIFWLLDGVVFQRAPAEAVPAQLTHHVEEGAPHEPYSTVPPTSGAHYGFAVAPWGVSPLPIKEELFVHNLEHGGVLLFYNCDCSPVAALFNRLATPATGYPVKVISAPYRAMTDEVVLLAWHYKLVLDASDVTEEAVRAFIDTYIDHGFEYIAAETEQLTAWRAAGAP